MYFWYGILTQMTLNCEWEMFTSARSARSAPLLGFTTCELQLIQVHVYALTLLHGRPRLNHVVITVVMAQWWPWVDTALARSRCSISSPKQTPSWSTQLCTDHLCDAASSAEAAVLGWPSILVYLYLTMW